MLLDIDFISHFKLRIYKCLLPQHCINILALLEILTFSLKCTYYCNYSVGIIS